MTAYFVTYPDGTITFTTLAGAKDWALENANDFYGETIRIYKGELLGEVIVPDPEPYVEWKRNPEELVTEVPDKPIPVPTKTGIEAAQDEMQKLRDALDYEGIEWKDDSSAFAGITRTKFTNKLGEKCSVICGEFTYGGKFGLLEAMPPIDPDYDEDEVQGWLTADEIIEAWMQS